jgi:putative addiction module component (TIGR02574 family)
LPDAGKTQAGSSSSASLAVRLWAQISGCYDGFLGSINQTVKEERMSGTLESLGIDKLSVAERILLVEEIWDSIAPEVVQLPIPDSQRLDLQRRVAEYDANPSGSTWEEVRGRLRQS